MRKFKVGNFLKNRGDCCDFLKVLDLVEQDTENSILIKAVFFTQLDIGWRKVSYEFWTKILKRDFKNWSVYEPRGELRDEL